MAAILVQVDDTLQLVNPTTGDAEVLDLPDGVTIDPDLIPSVATLARGAAIVYSPSRNLLLLADRTLVLLVPSRPSSTLTASAGAAGVLTGDYKYRFTFIRKDANDNIITESPMSDVSNTVTLTAQRADLSSIDISTDTDTVTGRRLYRTLSGGTIFFHLADIDDNSTTTFDDNIPDATLSILPETAILEEGPPGTDEGDEFKLKLIVSWKNRLWAVSNNPDQQDSILYTDDGTVYRWKNELTAYPRGQELHGVTALAPRRDQLGIMKRSGLWQITGDSDLSFQVIQIAIDEGGCVAPTSVVTVNDVVYWLGPDGVNRWGSSGVQSISDDKVRPWFVTDRFFNRTQFENAFGNYNPIRKQYELHLCEVGETTSEVWVVWNEISSVWFGPHRNDAIVLTASCAAETRLGLPKILIGGDDGNIYSFSESIFHDGVDTPIAMDVISPNFNGEAPDIEHHWGEVSILSRIESGGTLNITPYMGRLAAASGPVIAHNLTLGRERLRRLGPGAFVKLQFTNAQVDQPVTIHGLEIPFHELGRR